ncbi:peptidoglycan-binding protein [Geobacillus sp. 46C-IIa]|uniref:C40 family peptidase n=1 Tax=Geobacillus sp. 46C-IIa TaxID=1963025 RepID=UPI00117B4A39|nr:peptidoglycan-binding protein [Geobacillus sp. 46C-IIa]QNU28155.1 peptidoglycan-binding protein [Geobacillus sp. 46C-IIa]
MKSSHIVLATAFASALFLAPDDGEAAEWKEGMSSPKVKELQQLLKEKGFFSYPQATGYFGPITEEAVRAFQQAVHLPTTGVVDDATYAKLRAFVPTARALSVGMRGDDVKVLQQRLKQLGYFQYPQITGYFGTMTEAAVKQFQQANGLRATGKADAVTIERLRQAASQRTTATSSSSATLNIGSSGSKVSELQNNLKRLGYFTYPKITGYYGTVTADAVRRFQKDNDLPATGSVDPTTFGRIEDAVKKKTAPPAEEDRSSLYLTIGARGEEVKRVQANLKQLGYFTYPEITGYYGTVTADAVRRFQKDAKLQATGIVDDATYERLIGQAPAPKGQAPASSLDVIELIADAAELLGTPYVWGGETPEVGFDCSGFLTYVFKQQGVSLPRTVADIWSVGKPISSPAVGDIVFFETYKKGPSHAGIYIGNDQFVHSGASTGVTISQLNNPYWKARYLGAKRYY